MEKSATQPDSTMKLCPCKCNSWTLNGLSQLSRNLKIQKPSEKSHPKTQAHLDQKEK